MISSTAAPIKEGRRAVRRLLDDKRWNDARQRRFDKDLWRPIDEILTAAIASLEEISSELGSISQEAH